jgi:plastocyanin
MVPVVIGLMALSVLQAAAADPGASVTEGADLDNEDVAATIEIQSFLFQPNSVSIGVGGVVEWVNLDMAAHTAAGPGFDTGRLSHGELQRISFPTPGQFGYNCGYHANMAGVIIVE